MKVPGPGPYRPDYDPEDPWRGEIYWASRGNRQPLIDALRGDEPIGREVRDFIADCLDGKFKRRRGHVPEPRNWMGWEDPNTGEILAIKVSDLQFHQAASWVRNYRTEHGGRKEEALEKAAEEFGIKAVRHPKKKAERISGAQRLDNWMR